MSYLYFVLGSVFEYMSIFIFVFTLFRFPVLKQFSNMFIVSALMSQVSYFTRLNPEIGDLSSYIQLALFVTVLCVLYRVPLYYSVVMNGAGFVVGFAVQVIIIFSLKSMGIALIDLQDSPVNTAAVQVLSALMIISISRIIYIKNWGFDYVPTSHRSYIKVNSTNAMLLSIIVFSIVTACLSAYLLRFHFENYLIYVSAMFIITIPLFIYYSFRKDQEDAS